MQSRSQPETGYSIPNRHSHSDTYGYNRHTIHSTPAAPPLLLCGHSSAAQRPSTHPAAPLSSRLHHSAIMRAILHRLIVVEALSPLLCSTDRGALLFSTHRYCVLLLSAVICWGKSEFLCHVYVAIHPPWRSAHALMLIQACGGRLRFCQHDLSVSTMLSVRSATLRFSQIKPD